ncbi:MAG: nuclear transport factor 2 family protein [Thermoleophilaceae bacterium]
MGESNLDLVRELMERFNDDRDSVFELLSEDFVVEIPPSLSAEPDVYEGHDGARRYLDAFEGLLEDVRFVALEYHEEGAQVIVDMLLKGRGVASRIEVEMRSATVHWVEDGKVARIQPFPDLESAREALRRA